MGVPLMAKVRTRPETHTLYLDFHYRGVRCREQTTLADSPINRRTLDSLAKKMDRDIANGQFDYARYFPDSPRAKTLSTAAVAAAQSAHGAAIVEPTPAPARSPLFRDFAELWYRESEPRWRERYKKYIRATLEVL